MSDNELRQIFEDQVRAIDTETPGYAEKWRTFETIVLRDGGYAVVPRFGPDPTIDLLIQTGQSFSAEDASLRPGVERECHLNSVTLWRAGKALAIGTGYALSDDGLWREHSWAWGRDDDLIETTGPRISYFGLRLEGDDARRYSAWISGGDQ
jgi:hypothetical protein